MSRPARNRLRTHSGMTLLEVLVAFMVFVMMMGALVSLATAGLDTWTEGEEQRDVHERAQRILTQIAEDLRNTYADDRWIAGGQGRELEHASFVCDLDANGAQRLRFVRTGARNRVNAGPATRMRRLTSDLEYTHLWEIAYVLDPDPARPVLYRGLRFFDRCARGSILVGKEIGRATSPAFQQNFQRIDTGTLWVAYRFWTPFTTTWTLPGEEAWACANRSHSQLVTLPAPGRCPECGRDATPVQTQRLKKGAKDSREAIAPSLLWDSSRTDDDRSLADFFFRKRRKEPDAPDFCYPQIVRVTLVLETQASEVRGTLSASRVSSSDSFLRLNTTRGMPDGPAFAKLGAEWVEYSEKSIDGLRVKRRGARGTEALAHEPGTRVRFGATFATDVYIPAYREALR